MKSFRTRYDIPTPLQENHWASMPPEELHVQTRELMDKHGFEHKSGGPNTNRQSWTHREKSGMDYAFAHGFDPETDAEPPKPVGHVEVHRDLPSLGYQRNRRADFSFWHGNYGHDGVVYDHPNGTRLTVRHAEDEDSNEECHVDMGMPHR